MYVIISYGCNSTSQKVPLLRQKGHITLLYVIRITLLVYQLVYLGVVVVFAGKVFCQPHSFIFLAVKHFNRF